MQLTCPHCQFSKNVLDSRLPQQPTRVTCPQCKEKFPLPSPTAAPEKDPEIRCPACATPQPASSTCTACGLIFARYQEAIRSDKAASTATPTAQEPAPEESLTERPKAGFWLRLVAIMVDGFLIFLLQAILGLLLVLIGGDSFNLHGPMSLLLQGFTTLLSLFYWVFFTGYCGQTPGKMLLRIRVIRTDGGEIGYTKAFYREVIGKFISGLIFLIGYLMVAFDDQKQALHDRMARTYVVKL